MHVAAASFEDALAWTLENAARGTGRYVCVANVHMCMEAYDDHDFCKVVSEAGLVIPDGKPLAWGLRLLGAQPAAHMRGADFMMALCHAAAKKNIAVGLFGGTPESLAGLLAYLQKALPELAIPFVVSPPFRELTRAENAAYAEHINRSGAGILFVGLGCPKQEKWMALQQRRVDCVMLGVGAAFDFYSGRKKSAPRFMQKAGLEWLFRFASEPRRLWKRYLKHNPRFVLYLLMQLMSPGYFARNRVAGK